MWWGCPAALFHPQEREPVTCSGTPCLWRSAFNNLPPPGRTVSTACVFYYKGRYYYSACLKVTVNCTVLRGDGRKEDAAVHATTQSHVCTGIQVMMMVCVLHEAVERRTFILKFPKQCLCDGILPKPAKENLPGKMPTMRSEGSDLCACDDLQ